MDIESPQRGPRPIADTDRTSEPEAQPEPEETRVDRPGAILDRLRHLQARSREWAASRYRQLAAKGQRHWMSVALLIPSGVLLGHFLGDWKELETARFKIYHFLQSITPAESTHARRTVVVLIDDEEYWRGDLARRTPLKRDYLARLVRQLDRANPAVIALDIDLRAQTPNRRPIDHQDYRAETEALRRAVAEVSTRRTVVLTEPVIDTEEEGGFRGWRYERQPTVFEGVDFRPGDVKRGYDALPYDLRRVPLSITLRDGLKISSFAAAIVERLDPKSLGEARAGEDDGLPFGTFLPDESFTSLPAGKVLRARPEELAPVLAHQAVIIGGAWHTFSLGQGRVIDSRPTPAGEMVGAFIHANYVEALYLGRTKKPWPAGAGIAVEVFLSIGIAVFFALDFSLARNLAITLGTGVILAVLALVAWQNLGLFFDFFTPATLVVGHALVEQLEWKTGGESKHPLRRAA